VRDAGQQRFHFPRADVGVQQVEGSLVVQWRRGLAQPGVGFARVAEGLLGSFDDA
jgi:hypothetical protein